MTVLETVADSLGETVDSGSITALVRPLPLEPRCRVCRNDEMRAKVNDLLAVGASYAYIVRAVAAENAKLDASDRVTVDSVRNHCGRHFPVQNVAKATYREILERRAQENGIDFVNGVATAITPMAFLETVMARSYETLVDPDTQVDVHTGIIAAGRLQALIESRAAGTSMLDMWVKMDKIINAIKSTVPEEMWEEIAAKLDEPIAVGPPADELEDRDDVEDG